MKKIPQIKDGLYLSCIGHILALSDKTFVLNPFLFKNKFNEETHDDLPALGVPQNSITIGRLGRAVFLACNTNFASSSSS